MGQENKRRMMHLVIREGTGNVQSKKESESSGVTDGRMENTRKATVSDIVCIPAARQLDGSLYRGPYILFRNTATAPVIHQHKCT